MMTETRERKVLQYSSADVSGFGFRTRDGFSKFAEVFYLHHGGRVSEINAELEQKGLRPMTTEEFEDFFDHNEATLAAMRAPNYIATAEIKPHQSGVLVPGVWREDDNSISARMISFFEVGGDALISDHHWFVLGVDDKKTRTVK